MPSVALGDFNLTQKDDKKFDIYKNQEDYWYVAHREGCTHVKEHTITAEVNLGIFLIL